MFAAVQRLVSAKLSAEGENFSIARVPSEEKEKGRGGEGRKGEAGSVK